jgi:hypothetical protein
MAHGPLLSMTVQLLVLIPFTVFITVGLIWVHTGSERLRKPVVVLALLCILIDVLIVVKANVLLK